MPFPLLAAIPVVGKIIEKILGVVDQTVEDKDEKNRISAAIQTAVLTMDHQEVQTLVQEQASIIKAEATGSSWIQRSWRPLLMMLIIFIIFNNFVLFPYLTAFGLKAVALQLPAWMPELMKIGVGGYVIGRSGEKVVQLWKKKTDNGEE